MYYKKKMIQKGKRVSIGPERVMGRIKKTRIVEKRRSKRET